MNKNQNGFATLEIILVVGIIAIFSTVAVPKMARILDKVCLNYEMKHLYSDLNFARSIGKSSNFNGGIFTDFENAAKYKIEFWLYGEEYSSVAAKNHYQIMRPGVSSVPFFRHNLSNGIKVSPNINGGYSKPLTIDCYNFGSSRKIILTSKFKEKAYVYIDSVGRVSGSYENR